MVLACVISVEARHTWSHLMYKLVCNNGWLWWFVHSWNLWFDKSESLATMIRDSYCFVKNNFQVLQCHWVRSRGQIRGSSQTWIARAWTNFRSLFWCSSWHYSWAQGMQIIICRDLLFPALGIVDLAKFQGQVFMWNQTAQISK